jgi:hypothetical protein
MTIHTTASLQAKRRRLDRRLAEINHAAAALRAGAVLHLTYLRSAPQWTLSTGVMISDAAARAIVVSPNIVAVGDVLFDGMPSQTYRWACMKEDGNE